MQLLGKTRNDPVMIGKSLSLYTQSLGVLQKALMHPTEWKSSATLATAMLLCYFEVGDSLIS
jgi:hypothetical protein